MSEDKKEEQTEEVQSSTQEKQPTTVNNFGQALDVLLQAADIGRQEGIYDFNALSLIGQSIKIIKDAIKANSTNQPSPKDEK